MKINTAKVVSEPSIWTDGALGAVSGAKFLSIATSLFRRIAKQEGWPRKYQGTKVLFPRSLLVKYLAALPSVPPASVVAKARRLKKAAV